MGAAGTDGMGLGAAGAARSCLEKPVWFCGAGVSPGGAGSQCIGMAGPSARGCSRWTRCPACSAPLQLHPALHERCPGAVPKPCSRQSYGLLPHCVPPSHSPCPRPPPYTPRMLPAGCGAAAETRGVGAVGPLPPPSPSAFPGAQCCPSQGSDHAAVHHCNEFCLPSARQSLQAPRATEQCVCVWGGQHRVPSQCTHGAGPHWVTVLPQGLVSLCRGGCLCLTPTILGG